jgi:chromate reductase
MEPIRILGLSGSLRAGSHNSGLLRAAALTLPAGAQLEVFDGLRELPPYDADTDGDGAPAPVVALRSAIAAADGVLIATPEYNGSIPGLLKNALDWASRPYGESALLGKPVSITGTSTGRFGAAWAQADVRKVLEVIGADVIGSELPVPRAESAFGPDGHLADPELRATLTELLDVLAARAHAREGEAA